MIRNYLLCLLGISACLVPGTVDAILGGTIVSSRTSYLIGYEVSVQIRGQGHVCGGGAISNGFILSAAHCIINSTITSGSAGHYQLRSKHISIVAGSDNLNTSNYVIRAHVESVFFPKTFNTGADIPIGDIAVLKLKEPLPSLILLTAVLSENDGAPSITSQIFGFGWNEYHTSGSRVTGSSDGRLRVLNVHVQANEHNCNHGTITGQHICAAATQVVGNIHRGTCNGDEGGLLLSHGRVIGVLSRIAPHCVEALQPAVYTRVTHYIRSINNVMKQGRDRLMIQLHT